MQTCAAISLLLLLIFVFSLYIGSLFNENMAKLQRKFRVPIHIFAQVLCALLSVTRSRNSKNLFCSSFGPEYCPLEPLVTFLIWPASYPVFAAAPLFLSLPLQLLLCAIYMPHNRKICSIVSSACEQSGQQCSIFKRLLNKLALVLPFGLNGTRDVHFPREMECQRLLLLAEVVVLVIISSYISFGVELARRLAYCVASERYELQFELWRRRTPAWKIVLEIIVASALAWKFLILVNILWLPFWAAENGK